MADLASKNTDSVTKAFQAGLISQKVALKELRQQSELTGMWTNISDQDIENADDEVMSPDEGMGGDMFGNPEQQEAKDSRPFVKDFNPYHAPETGEYTTAEGASGAKLEENSLTKESGDDKIIVSPIGVNKFKVRGFPNKQKLLNHWKNGRVHREDYPELKTAEEYEQKALELLESAVGGDILGHVDKNDVIIRYNQKTKDFAKGHPAKGVRTMFKPKDEDAYYQEQRKEDLEHGGRG